MKKFFITIFICFFGFHPAYSQTAGNIDYDAVYKNLPILDFHYEQNEDPDEATDYRDYVNSPYPLVRIYTPLTCKNYKIIPNYYLLTPRTQNGYDFVLFKQKGKILAIIPTYEKQLINPQVVYKEPPKPKVSPIKKPFIAFGKMFKKYQKPLDPPKNELKVEFVNGGKYVEIWLYQNDFVYKMLFLTEGAPNKH